MLARECFVAYIAGAKRLWREHEPCAAGPELRRFISKLHWTVDKAIEIPAFLGVAVTAGILAGQTAMKPLLGIGAISLRNGRQRSSALTLMELSEAEIAIIKARIIRGDKYSNIDFDCLVSQGRISDLEFWRLYPSVAPVKLNKPEARKEY